MNERAASGGNFWRGLLIPCVLVVAWAVAGHVGETRSRLLVPPERVLLAPFVDADARNLWRAPGRWF